MTEADAKLRTPRDAAQPGAAGFHSLLVPIDLTPGSDRVLGRVARLPLAEDAQVTILHVVPGSLAASEQRRAERDARKALVDEVRHLRPLLGRKVRVEPVVTAGAAAKEIAARAAKVRAELIVMGRGSGRALRDAVLGSTAERVVRQAQRPVLVVRLPPRAAYSRPLLALDMDEAAQESLRLVLRVLPPPRPRLEIIHAFEMPYQGLIYPSLSEDDAEERKDELRSSASEKLDKLLAGALARTDHPREAWPSWRTHVRYGGPRLVVEKAMKKIEPDLLVLGTHGYSGAAYMFLGTVAGDLLRAAACDVLVVPPVSRRAR